MANKTFINKTVTKHCKLLIFYAIIRNAITEMINCVNKFTLMSGNTGCLITRGDQKGHGHPSCCSTSLLGQRVSQSKD